MMKILWRFNCQMFYIHVTKRSIVMWTNTGVSKKFGASLRIGFPELCGNYIWVGDYEGENGLSFNLNWGINFVWKGAWLRYLPEY